MPKYVTVIIDGDKGEITFDAEGFKGKSCLEKLGGLEKAFKTKKSKLTKKKEFFEAGPKKHVQISK